MAERKRCHPALGPLRTMRRWQPGRRPRSVAGCQFGLRSLSTTIARTPSAKSGCAIVVRVSANSAVQALLAASGPRRGATPPASSTARRARPCRSAFNAVVRPVGVGVAPRSRRDDLGDRCRPRSNGRSPPAVSASENGGSGLVERGQRGDAVLRPARPTAPAGRARGVKCVANPACTASAPVHAQPGQAEIGAELAGQARQEERGADIGEEADRRLRHGERGVFGGDAIRRMHRHADAAAHADAVDQRDVRLRIGRDRQVQRVFLAEELSRRWCGRRRAGRRAARGYRRRRRRRDRRRPRSPRRATCGSSRHVSSARGAGADHRQVERVQRLRAVEQDATHAAVAAGDDGLFGGHPVWCLLVCVGVSGGRGGCQGSGRTGVGLWDQLGPIWAHERRIRSRSRVMHPSPG